MPVQHDSLMCEVSSLAYDFDSKKGKIVMAPGQCVDMRGCIDLFTGIDGGVQQIETFAGEALDTVYRLKDGEWHSILAR